VATIPDTVGGILTALVGVAVLTALFNSAGTATAIDALGGDAASALAESEGHNPPPPPKTTGK